MARLIRPIEFSRRNGVSIATVRRAIAAGTLQTRQLLPNGVKFIVVGDDGLPVQPEAAEGGADA